jgi:deoxyribodipyrimidine photo-lyase
MPTLPTAALVWFRRDLRLADNPALAAAVSSGRPVVCLFVLDESPASRPLGGAARWWLDKSLRALAASLEAIGGRLILRRGDPRVQVPALAAEIGAGLVTWNRLYEPAVVERDAALKADLKAAGIEVRSFNAALLNEPWTVRTGAGGPFQVFTPYWRAARAQIGAVELAPEPAALAPPASWPASEAIDAWRLHPHHPDWSGGFTPWRPGEAGALARLDRFLLKGLPGYGARRDQPGDDAGSGLSPHLHWGEIGPRQIWRRAMELAAPPAQDLDKFLAELGWREFNHQLLFHHGDLAQTNVRRAFDAFGWREDPSARAGRTGHPMVDAGLRELWATGFMHNRVRMIAASFLIKHLLIDWREGERWFWDTLVDADLASNAANWQWVAGCGADAAPFFRIFNPITQGEKFDPRGAYVRRWVPELARLPDDALHAPWTAPPGVLAAAGVRLGRDYPRPIVDHAFARQRALDALARLKVEA